MWLLSIIIKSNKLYYFWPRHIHILGIINCFLDFGRRFRTFPYLSYKMNSSMYFLNNSLVYLESFLLIKRLSNEFNSNWVKTIFLKVCWAWITSFCEYLSKIFLNPSFLKSFKLMPYSILCYPNKILSKDLL